MPKCSMTIHSIPVAYLQECFDYDTSSGSLVWKYRPLEHFPDKRAWKITNTSFAGKPAGTQSPTGVKVRLTVDGKAHYLLGHHIALTLSGVSLPVGMVVDHRDGNPLNNRLDNLRVCTITQNVRNAKTGKNNSSGYPGVYREGESSWFARIYVDLKLIPLGWYKTRDEAIEARKQAELKYYGEFRRDNPVLPALDKVTVQVPLTKHERAWINSIGSL